MDRTSVVFIALLFVSCGTATQSVDAPQTLDPRDLPVIQAVITEIGTAYLERVPDHVMLLETRTRYGGWDGSTGGAVGYGAPADGWPVDVTEPLAARNEAVFRVDSLGPIPPTVQLVSPEAVRSALGRRSNWSKFARRFPSAFGVASISAPGFSKDGSRAGVVVSVYCGRLFGWGELLVLEPSANGWRIAHRYTLWES
jgi:hypothetical protein